MLYLNSFRLLDLWQQLTSDPSTILPWLQMVLLSLAIPLAVGVALLAIGRLALGSWRWGILASLCGSLMLFAMASYWPPRVPPLPDNNISFRIAHLNALVYNHTFPPKLDFIRAANAQLVSLAEAHPDLMKEVEIHTTTFRHKQVTGYGTVLLSAWPLKKMENFTDKAALFKVEPPDAKPFYVLQLHPIAPSTPTRLASRNALWQRLTQATLPQPLVVVGDTNTVPWDPLLSTFAEKNTLKTHGWFPSFPSIMPVVPIDLLLTPPGWHATLRRVFVAETDHLGWVADIKL